MTGVLMMSVGNSYGSLPVNTVAPVVSGTATVGSTLTTTNGTWLGAPAPTFTYQWQRGVSNISGATSSTYVVQLADVGNTLRCVVTGTNAVGSASANSNSTASVASPYWASFLASTTTNALATYDNAVDSSNNVILGGRNNGGLISKTNSAGTLQWQRVVESGSIGQFEVLGVATDSTNAVYMVGQTGGFGQLVKLDASGNVIFRKTTSGVGNTGFRSIRVDSSNNIYIAAATAATALNIKADSSGTPIWARTLEDTSGSPTDGHRIAVDTSSNVYFLYERSEDSGRTTRVYKLNSSGTFQWRRRLYGSSGTTTRGGGVATDGAGNVYVVGTTNHATSGQTHAYLAKFNTSGVLQWQRRLGSSFGVQTPHIDVNSAGDALITGYTNNGSINLSIVALYSTSGVIQWQRSVLWSSNTPSGALAKFSGASNFYLSGTGQQSPSFFAATNAFLPLDGSRTGSYTNFAYQVSSLTEAASTLFQDESGANTAVNNNLSLPDSTALTVSTGSFTPSLTNV